MTSEEAKEIGEVLEHYGLEPDALLAMDIKHLVDAAVQAERERLLERIEKRAEAYETDRSEMTVHLSLSAGHDMKVSEFLQLKAATLRLVLAELSPTPGGSDETG